MHTLATFKFTLDHSSRRPIYLQLADGVRMERALGRARPGQRLPAIRTLARNLNLDPSTVARAYQELERNAVIIGQRGRGSFFAGPGLTPQPSISERHRKMEHNLEKAILEGLGLGFTAGEIETAFITRLSRWRLSGPPEQNSHN